MFSGVFKLLVKFWGRLSCEFMFSCGKFCVRFSDISGKVLKFNGELTGILKLVMLDVKLGCEFEGKDWRIEGRFWFTVWFMLLICAFFKTMNPFSSGVKGSIIFWWNGWCAFFFNCEYQALFRSVSCHALQRAIWGLFPFVFLQFLGNNSCSKAILLCNSPVQFSCAILQLKFVNPFYVLVYPFLSVLKYFSFNQKFSLSVYSKYWPCFLTNRYITCYVLYNQHSMYVCLSIDSIVWK